MKKTILLAEDVRDDVVAFTRVLRSAGILNPIAEVCTGVETIAYLNGDPPFADPQKYPFPSVLFLDLLMPNGDGWEVLRWLKNNPAKSNVLVIVLTGVAQRHNLREAYLAGANSFLVKPFNATEMDSLVSTWPHVWELRPNDPRVPPRPEDKPNRL